MTDNLKMPAFVWWTGQVEDVGDPLKLGRCRVRIVGHHSPDKNSVPTKTLPWAHCLQPTTSAAMAGIGSSPTGLLVGSWVVGFFQDGENLQHPVIMGSFGGINPSFQEMVDSAEKAFSHPVNQVVPSLIPFGLPSLSRAALKILEYAEQPDTNKLARGEELPTTIHGAKLASLTKGLPIALVKGGSWSEPPSPYRAIYPNNKVYESKSGHVFEVDDTPTGERLHKYHRAGTFEEIHPDGTQVEKIVGDNYQIIYGEDRKGIGGSATINIDGDANIAIRGSINIQTSGDDIKIYFPNSSRVSLDTGTFLHNVHGQYILNVKDGILIDGTLTDLNNPAYSPLRAAFMDVPDIGRLTPNSSSSNSAEYAKALFEQNTRIFVDGNTENTAYTQMRQIRQSLGLEASEDPDQIDTPEQVETSLEQLAVQSDSILAQLGDASANIIGGIAEDAINAVTEGIAGAGESLVNVGIAAVTETQAFQAFQTGVIQAQQSIALAQNVANNLQGAAGQVCAVLDMFSALDGVSFGSPAEFFEKLANAVQPLEDLPEAIGDAFERMVEGAVAAVEQFAAGIVQSVTDVIDQTFGVLDTVAGLFTDPCGEGSGLVAPGDGAVSQVAAGAVSGDLGDALGVDSYEKASLEDQASSTRLIDNVSLESTVEVLDFTVAKGQGGTKVSGLPVLTLPSLGAVAGFAGLGLGLAALLSGGGGAGGPGEQGPTGPTGSTGPDEEWNVLEPTKATNLEGIPQGTTFAFGLSPLDILKELLYPSLLRFNSFDIGINDEGERIPYHVGDKTLSGDYLSSWTLQDLESAVESSLKIVESENVLVENLDNTLTEYTINHPEYTRNTEGSVDFVVSVLNEKEQEVTKTDSIFWRYPLYAGKTAGNVITSDDLETLSVTTNQPGGKNPFINYTIQQMKNGITMIFPQTNEPEYLYWVVPKEVDGESTNPPSYGMNTSFTDVSNPNVTTVVPMTKMNDISMTKYDLSIDFDVYRSSVPFIASRTIKVSE